jgi:hypothetical protein
MQAQIEKTININMSAQTILTKYPKKNLTGTNGLSSALNVNLNTNLTENDYSTYFKPIFDYVSILIQKFE